MNSFNSSKKINSGNLELDANNVNFVYYGKTQFAILTYKFVGKYYLIF